MFVQLPNSSRGDLRHHAERALVPLGLALRQQAEVRDLGAGEQRGRGVRAGRDTRAAADAGRRVHGAVGVFLADEDVVAVDGAAGRNRDVAAGRDDAVESAAVHHKILQDRERPRAPRLQVEFVAVLEVPHVKLAHRGAWQRAVRDAVDHEPARCRRCLRGNRDRTRSALRPSRSGSSFRTSSISRKDISVIDVRACRSAPSGPASLGALLPPDVEDESSSYL